MNQQNMNYHLYQMPNIQQGSYNPNSNNELLQNNTINTDLVPMSSGQPRDDLLNKEQRRIQQEEYRRQLDIQRKENQERKEREKQYYQYASNKITPEQNKAVSLKQNDMSNQPPMSDKEIIKERERQKRIEYNKLLQEQIDEKKLQKEKEKLKQEEDERKAANKYQQMIKKEEPLIYLKGKNNIYNQMLTTEEQMLLQQHQQFNPAINNNTISFHKPQLTNHNEGITIQGLNNLTISPSIKQYTNSHMPSYTTTQNRILSPYEQIQSRNTTAQQYQSSHDPSNSNLYKERANRTPSNLEVNSHSRRNHGPPTESAFNITQPMNNYGQFNTYQPHQPMLPIGNINEIFQNFVNHQMGIIVDYQTKVEQINILHPNKNNNELIELLMIERNNTMEKIKYDQEQMKTFLGFYPMQNEFNNKVSRLLNMILEKKVEVINSQPKFNIQSIIKESIVIDNQKSPDAKKSIVVLNQSHNRPKESNVISSQLRRDIQDCNYHSKYEDLKQSIMNFEDVSHELRQSLAGFSKFVNTNNNGNINTSTSDKLYQTWKGNWRYEGSERNTSKLESIDEEILKKQYSNKPVYDKSQSKNLMSHSLEHSDIIMLPIKDGNMDSNQSNEINLSQFKSSYNIPLSKPKNNGKPMNAPIKKDNENNKNYDNNYKKEQPSETINYSQVQAVHEFNKFQSQLNFFEDSLVEKNSPVRKHEIPNENNNNNPNIIKRPSSPKLKQNLNTNSKQHINNDNSHYSNNIINDSYGDNIINNLNKYRQMVMDDSSRYSKHN